MTIQSRSPLYQIVTLVTTALFKHEFDNLTKREANLISRHFSMGGSSDGFRYMGLTYTELQGQSRSRGRYDLLKKELVADMDALIEDRQTVENDLQWVRQTLVLVLKGCRSDQDIRDALPNSLKDMLPSHISRLERTRPEAWTLAENERSYKQYMKLREKIEFYTATRLLY